MWSIRLWDAHGVGTWLRENLTGTIMAVERGMWEWEDVLHIVEENTLQDYCKKIEIVKEE